jgi:hypothetical protein
VIDFKNTVLIMTSNLGARDISKGGGLGFHRSDAKTSYEIIEDKVREEIERAFNPEFLNRVDDTIVFHPLTAEQIGEIVHIVLKDVRTRLGEEQMTLKLTPEAIDFLSKGLRREVRRPAAQAGDPALPRGSTLGEDPDGRVHGGRRDRGRGGGGRNRSLSQGRIAHEDVIAIAQAWKRTGKVAALAATFFVVLAARAGGGTGADPRRRRALRPARRASSSIRSPCSATTGSRSPPCARSSASSRGRRQGSAKSSGAPRR